MRHTLCTKILYSIILAVLIGCGGVPPTYYYRIHYDMPGHNSPDPLPVTIGVEPFAADVPYKEDRIVYRDSEYEVRFYHYRRWVAPPPRMVTKTVLEQFQSSHVFDRVIGFPSQARVDYVLRGNIRAFEEWDEAGEWYGHVSIAFELQDRETGQVLWQKDISEKTKAQKKEPVAVVEAISESLRKVVERAIGEVQQNLGGL